MKKTILSALLLYPLLVLANPAYKWRTNITNNCSYFVWLKTQNTYQWAPGSLASEEPISPYSTVVQPSYPSSSGNMVDDSINWAITQANPNDIVANFLFSFTSSAADDAAFPNYVLDYYSNSIGMTEYILFAGVNGAAQINSIYANSSTNTIYVSLTTCPTSPTAS